MGRDVSLVHVARSPVASTSPQSALGLAHRTGGTFGPSQKAANLFAESRRGLLFEGERRSESAARIRRLALVGGLLRRSAPTPQPTKDYGRP